MGIMGNAGPKLLPKAIPAPSFSASVMKASALSMASVSWKPRARNVAIGYGLCGKSCILRWQDCNNSR